MDSSDRDRKRAWKQRQRETASSVFPLPDDSLQSMFNAVETQVEERGCDHSHRFTSLGSGSRKTGSRWRKSLNGLRRTGASVTVKFPPTLTITGCKTSEGVCIVRSPNSWRSDSLGIWSVWQFRKKIHTTPEELQADLGAWICSYNHERTHQGKMCCGRTSMATFEDRHTPENRVTVRSGRD